MLWQEVEHAKKLDPPAGAHHAAGNQDQESITNLTLSWRGQGGRHKAELRCPRAPYQILESLRDASPNMKYDASPGTACASHFASLLLFCELKRTRRDALSHATDMHSMFLLAITAQLGRITCLRAHKPEGWSEKNTRARIHPRFIKSNDSSTILDPKAREDILPASRLRRTPLSGIAEPHQSASTSSRKT
jgi:hypothetical protein